MLHTLQYLCTDHGQHQDEVIMSARAIDATFVQANPLPRTGYRASLSGATLRLREEEK